VNGGKPGVKDKEPRCQDTKMPKKNQTTKPKKGPIKKKSKASLEGFGFYFLMLIWHLGVLASWILV